MTSYEQHVPILDFRYKKSAPNSPKRPNALEPREDLRRDALDDQQHTKVQLRKQVADLQAQNKELVAYAATVAHDLKDPLYALLLTSSLITNTPEITQSQLKNNLERITSSAVQMNRIINNLLLFAKVNNTEALVEPMNMNQVVANVLDRLSHTINQHQAQIDTPDTWPVAIGYTPWVEEVWANYLSNAIKYGGLPPRAELGASVQPDGLIRYWMRDNGPGLSTDDQARLFVPFTKIDQACTSGHGLGLSIVFRIVKKLGGQVGCESEPGKGSLFFFTLPADLSSS